MKVSCVISGVLAFSTGIATAAPVTATDAHLAATANLEAVSDLRSSPGVSSRQSSLDGALGPLLKTLPPALANNLQSAVAEVFKGGDVVLNTPVDAIEGLSKGSPAGAGKDILSQILKASGSPPKDAASIFGGGK